VARDRRAEAAKELKLDLAKDRTVEAARVNRRAEATRNQRHTVARGATAKERRRLTALKEANLAMAATDVLGRALNTRVIIPRRGGRAPRKPVRVRRQKEARKPKSS
jgi:hypothetical protein